MIYGRSFAFGTVNEEEGPRAYTQNAEVEEGNKSLQCLHVFFVKGIHNHISDTLLRSPVGGPEAIERALRRLRGNAWYAYNSVVSCVTGHICKEVIGDPALD